MHKNTRLIISAGGLVVLIAFTWWFSRPVSSAIVGKDLLELGDTAAISSIEMVSPRHTVLLKRTGQGWQVNDRYRADRSIRNFMLGVLERVRVKREIGASQSEEIAGWLANGVKVKVVGENGVMAEFTAAGNPAKTESYFRMAGDNQIYQVELPGYPNYVSGIFEFSENQWRNRLLFSSDWRTIQSLAIDYTAPEIDDVVIAFDKTTLKVAGLASTDTVALDKYIQRYESFYTNEFIVKGQIPVYDSLMETQPIATIRLKDIDTEKNTELQVYNGPPDQPYMLLRKQDGSYSVCDASRVRALLIRQADLRAAE